jgi:hypothetical protein
MRLYALVGAAVLLCLFLIGLSGSYLGRVQLVSAQRLAFQDSTDDRRSEILMYATQASANQLSADASSVLPESVRRARAVEAAQGRAAVRDLLTRVDEESVTLILDAAANDGIRRLVLGADTGRRLNCTEQHPSPSLLPL